MRMMDAAIHRRSRVARKGPVRRILGLDGIIPQIPHYIARFTFPMALKKLPYTKIGPLLKEYLSTQEDGETAALMRELRQARVRRYLGSYDRARLRNAYPSPQG
jgi:hypothetical protein